MDWEKHAHRSKLYIFASYYKKHLGLFGLDMVCALGIALVDIAFPLVSKRALESLLPGRLYVMFFTVMGILIAAYAAAFGILLHRHLLGAYPGGADGGGHPQRPVLSSAEAVFPVL